MSDALLARAFGAYRQGLRKRGETASPMGPRDFDALTFLGSLGRIPLHERSRLRRLQRTCGQALSSARAGDLPAAAQLYEEAGEDVDRLAAGNRLGWLLAISAYEAGRAYLDFRRQEAVSARGRLERAMDADLELEREGIPVLQIHRLQQGHNLARMDFRLGRSEAAIELTGQLVAYIERELGSLPYHHDWRPEALGTRELLRSMIRQVLDGTAGQLAGSRAAPESWRRWIASARLKADPEKALFPQAQYALRAQAARLDRDFAGYLENLERFFLPGIREIHSLWYALMADLLDYCLEADSPLSRRAAAAIVGDARKWKHLSPQLRSRFEGAPSSAGAA